MSSCWSRTRQPRSIALLLAVAVWLSFASGCSKCASSELAELTSLAGSVDRDYSNTQERWQSASEGAVFGLGDGLRTGKGGRAELALRPSGRALVEEHTVLRFLSEKPEDGVELMQVEEGTVEIDSAAVEITLRIGGEVAHIAEKSRVRIRAASANEASLDVIVGRVQIEHGSASRSEDANLAAKPSTETVVAGNSIALGLVDDVQGATGSAPSAVSPVEAEKPAGATEPSAPALDVEPESGTIVSTEPEPADVAPLRLERATFHVTKAPLHFAVPLPACDDELRLRISGKGKRRELSPKPGQTAAVIDLKAGTHKISLRCGKREVATTSLRVVKDAGTLELPRSAPTIDVAADGRRYTVKYQNLLPSVTFSWPNAPSGPYTLKVLRKGKAPIARSSSTPRVVFASGELSEGEHTFSFQGAGQTSKPTIVRIAFDDSARVGFLSAPSEGSAATQSLLVSGGSLHRAEVSVDGKEVTLDSHGRFSTNIAPSPQRNAIAVRMNHPSTGVHYYIRRLDGAVR